MPIWIKLIIIVYFICYLLSWFSIILISLSAVYRFKELFPERKFKKTSNPEMVATVFRCALIFATPVVHLIIPYYFVINFEEFVNASVDAFAERSEPIDELSRRDDADCREVRE